MKNIKKFLAVLLSGISALSPNQAGAEERRPSIPQDSSAGQEQVKYRFSKQQLIAFSRKAGCRCYAYTA
jgi:hypothetical protein